MEIIGIICEFNPLHNGHIYFINEVKKRYPDSILILALSGNFTERGDVSFLSKEDKVKLSLDNNIDIVLEVPSIYVTNSADYFAKYTVSALDNAGVTKIICGSETDDISKLTKILKKLESSDDEIRLGLSKGKSYAESNFSLIKTKIKSNDILALSYLKAIKSINPYIELELIKRTNTFLDTTSNDNIISAENIRCKLMSNTPIERFVPASTLPLIKIPNYDKLFEYIKYRTITSDNLDEYIGSEEGLSNRLEKYIKEASNYDELVTLLSTKRISKSRVKRYLTHLLLGFKKEDFIDVDYTRILGFTSRGQKYLNTHELPNLVYKVQDRIRESELVASKVYDILTNSNSYLYEQSNKPIIKK